MYTIYIISLGTIVIRAEKWGPPESSESRLLLLRHSLPWIFPHPHVLNASLDEGYSPQDSLLQSPCPVSYCDSNRSFPKGLVSPYSSSKCLEIMMARKCGVERKKETKATNMSFRGQVDTYVIFVWTLRLLSYTVLAGWAHPTHCWRALPEGMVETKPWALNR